MFLSHGLVDGWNIDLTIELLSVRNVLSNNCFGSSVSSVVDGSVVQSVQVDVGGALATALSESHSILVHLGANAGDLLLFEINDLLLATIGASELAEDDTLAELGVLSVLDSLELFGELSLTWARVVDVGSTVSAVRAVVLSLVARVDILSVTTSLGCAIVLVGGLAVSGRGLAVGGLAIWGLASDQVASRVTVRSGCSVRALAVSASLSTVLRGLASVSTVTVAGTSVVGRLGHESAVADSLALFHKSLSLSIGGSSTIDLMFRSVMSGTGKVASVSDGSAAHSHVVLVLDLELSNLVTLGPFAVRDVSFAVNTGFDTSVSEGTFVSGAIVLSAVTSDQFAVAIVLLRKSGARVVIWVPPAVTVMVSVGSVPGVDTLGRGLLLLLIPEG